jgi:dCMP deaminase
MSNQNALAIDNIYQETKDFLIIGLTGRTGSGCTTAADKLSSASFDIPFEGYEGLSENELKKHKIIKNITIRLIGCRFLSWRLLV